MGIRTSDITFDLGISEFDSDYTNQPENADWQWAAHGKGLHGKLLGNLDKIAANNPIELFLDMGGSIKFRGDEAGLTPPILRNSDFTGDLTLCKAHFLKTSEGAQRSEEGQLRDHENGCDFRPVEVLRVETTVEGARSTVSQGEGEDGEPGYEIRVYDRNSNGLWLYSKVPGRVYHIDSVLITLFEGKTSATVSYRCNQHADEKGNILHEDCTIEKDEDLIHGGPNYKIYSEPNLPTFEIEPDNLTAEQPFIRFPEQSVVLYPYYYPRVEGVYVYPQKLISVSTYGDKALVCLKQSKQNLRPIIALLEVTLDEDEGGGLTIDVASITKWPDLLGYTVVDASFYTNYAGALVYHRHCKSSNNNVGLNFSASVIQSSDYSKAETVIGSQTQVVEVKGTSDIEVLVDAFYEPKSAVTTDAITGFSSYDAIENSTNIVQYRVRTTNTSGGSNLYEFNVYTGSTKQTLFSINLGSIASGMYEFNGSCRLPGQTNDEFTDYIRGSRYTVNSGDYSHPILEEPLSETQSKFYSVVQVTKYLIARVEDIRDRARWPYGLPTAGDKRKIQLYHFQDGLVETVEYTATVDEDNKPVGPESIAVYGAINARWNPLTKELTEIGTTQVAFL